MKNSLFPYLGDLSDRLGNIMEPHLTPFDNLFGFKRSEVTKGDFYHGTIFRLPLRTAENAARSAIRKDKPYSVDEARELFEMTRKYGELLLLFTQFVGKFTMYVLEDGADTMEVYENCCYKRSLLPFPSGGQFSASYPQVLQGSDDAFTRIYRVEIKCNESVCDYVVSVCAPGERSTDKTRCVGAVALNINGPPANMSHLLFCFLPIPQPPDTGLPFMVNGTFAITSSRRQIEIQTMDDKADDSRFNNVILGQAVPEALINVLSVFAETHSESETLKFFPNTYKTEANIHLVVRQFYKLFVSSLSLKVFGRRKVAMADPRVKIMSPSLPANVRTEIVNFFSCYDSQQNIIYLDIPSFLTDVLQKFEPTFLRSKIATLSSVLPNLVSRLIPVNVTSVLTVLQYVLSDTNCLEANKNVLTSRPWILSQDTSAPLKKPCELINPEGNAFSISQCLKECLVSPLMNFSAELVRILLYLQMPKNDLPKGAFAKLFEQLQNKSGDEKILEEFSQIVQYLEDNPSFDHKEWATLLKIPCKGSSKSSLKWINARDCYDKRECETIVGLSETTVCLESLGIKRQGVIDRILKLWRIPNNSIVLKNALLTMKLSNLDDRIERLISIFTFLEKVITNRDEIPKSFKDKLLIPTSTSGVVKMARDVAVYACPGLTGHLYKVHPKLRKSVAVEKFLIRKLGCRGAFSPEDYSQILFKMNNITVSPEMAAEIIDILKYLTRFGADTFTGSVCIPTSAYKMGFPEDMCFGEETDCLPGFQAQFCHQDIPPSLAKALNVKTLRQLELKHVSNNVILKPFGQYEKLTKRLAGIVEEYSSDVDIFKEMLQNADDAGATECDFIFDQRNLTTENLVDEGWESLQGPSLIIFNNAPFTRQDITGLQCLGEGSKAQDVLKIGQYGVGFNCVYKFTDTPCFVTQLDGKGPGIFCLLDPDYQIVKRTGLSATPGACLDLSPELVKRRSGTFESFLLQKYDVLNAKTLFRLPLRKKGSQISSYCPTSKDMHEIFQKFCNSLKQIVLFLNIKKVRVLTIAADGTEFLLRQVTREVADKNLSDHETWKQKIRKVETGSPMSLLFNVTLNDSSGGSPEEKPEQQKWTIMEHVGSETPIPDIVRNELGSSGKMSCIKLHAAVAFHHSPSNKAVNPKLYCYLPLPNSASSEAISLPVAVNGPFSLDESRRSIKLEDNNSSHKWNVFVLENLVGECYADFVLQAAENLIKKKANYKEFMKLLPSSAQTRFPSSCEAHLICQGLFRHLAAKQMPFVPVLDVDDRMKSLAMPNQVFEFSKKDYQTLYTLAIELNLPITQLDKKYGKFWRNCGCDIKALSADQIIRVLPQVISTPCPIGETVVKNQDTLLYLLDETAKENPDFFRNTAKSGGLANYPIFLTLDDVLHRSNESNLLFSCTGTIQVIFPMLRHSIINSEVENGLWYSWSFRRMDTKDFLIYMKQFYPYLCTGADIPLAEDHYKWLADVWHFLLTRGKEEIDQSMNDFKNMSLLPCRNSKNETVLISISKCGAILKSRETITVGLASIDISSIDTIYSFCSDPLKGELKALNFAHSFIPDQDERLSNPQFVLKVLYQVYMRGNFEQISSHDRQLILDYCVEKKEELFGSGNCVDLLSQLPIHPNLKNEYVSLPADKRKFCVNDNVPREGLLEKTDSVGYYYFKTYNEKFQKKLGVIHQQDEQLYIEFAIPFAFEIMSTQNLHKHLEFLNSYYQSLKKSASSDEARNALTQALSNASFVRISEGCVRKPKELHSPDQELYCLFVPSDYLVPQEYMNKFFFLMNSLGVQKVITEKQFRRFCEELAHKVIERGSFDDMMKQQSKSLLKRALKKSVCGSSFEAQKDGSILSQETLEIFAGLEIFWDINGKPVSLKGAFHHDYLPLVSQVAKVLNMFVPAPDNSILLKGKPDESLVFANLEKLATLLKATLESKEDEKTRDTLEKTFISQIKECIKYFSPAKIASGEMKAKIAKCECILTKNKHLMSPNLICVSLPRDAFSGMRNYIDTPASEFMDIIPQLKYLGAEYTVTLKQLQLALTKVYDDFMKGEKDPNFKETMKYMVELFFQNVIDHPEGVKDLPDRIPLYLLSQSEEMALQLSRDLCFVDIKASSECRKRWNKKYILHIPKEKMEIREHLGNFAVSHRVTSMSSLIETTLENDTFSEENKTSENWLECFKDSLTSPVFYEVLAGYLIYIQAKSDEKIKIATDIKRKVGEKEYHFCNKILLERKSKRAGTFEPFIDDSQTVWETDDKLIFGSIAIGSEDDLKNKIIDSVLMPLCSKDAETKKLKDLIFERITDNKRQEWLSEITGDEVAAPVNYQPGDEVPPGLLALLDQKPFQVLETAVLVALLESGNLDDESATYKFARVVGTLKEPTPDETPPDFGLYELNVGREEVWHSVKGVDIFVFKSSNTKTGATGSWEEEPNGDDEINRDFLRVEQILKSMLHTKDTQLRADEEEVRKCRERLISALLQKYPEEERRFTNLIDGLLKQAPKTAPKKEEDDDEKENSGSEDSEPEIASNYDVLQIRQVADYILKRNEVMQKQYNEYEENKTKISNQSLPFNVSVDVRPPPVQRFAFPSILTSIPNITDKVAKKFGNSTKAEAWLRRAVRHFDTAKKLLESNPRDNSTCRHWAVEMNLKVVHISLFLLDLTMK